MKLNFVLMGILLKEENTKRQFYENVSTEKIKMLFIFVLKGGEGELYSY